MSSRQFDASIFIVALASGIPGDGPDVVGRRRNRAYYESPATSAQDLGLIASPSRCRMFSVFSWASTTRSQCWWWPRSSGPNGARLVPPLQTIFGLRQRLWTLAIMSLLCAELVKLLFSVRSALGWQKGFIDDRRGHQTRRCHLDGVVFLRRPRRRSPTRFGFSRAGPFRCENPRFWGLEKLRFPWILSFETRLSMGYTRFSLRFFPRIRHRENAVETATHDFQDAEGIDSVHEGEFTFSF